MFYKLITISALVAAVYAKKDGAPIGACSGLMPGHGEPAQSTPAPYAVSIMKVNGEYKFTLRGINNQQFKGFLVQMRSLASDKPIGHWDVMKDTPVKTLDCAGDANAVTHVDNADKGAVTAVWTPPNGFSGRVKPMYSVVKTYHDYWVAIDGPTFNISNDDDNDNETNKPSSGAKVMAVFGSVVAALISTLM